MSGWTCTGRSFVALVRDAVQTNLPIFPAVMMTPSRRGLLPTGRSCSLHHFLKLPRSLVTSPAGDVMTQSLALLLAAPFLSSRVLASVDHFLPFDDSPILLRCCSDRFLPRCAIDIFCFVSSECRYIEAASAHARLATSNCLEDNGRCIFSCIRAIDHTALSIFALSLPSVKRTKSR